MIPNATILRDASSRMELVSMTCFIQSISAASCYSYASGGEKSKPHYLNQKHCIGLRREVS